MWRLVLAFLVLPPAVAHAQVSDDERARMHFEAGRSYYDQARYEDAEREFMESYRLSQRIELLVNVATCRERAGDLAGSVEMLERYLSERSDAPDRRTIEGRIEQLRARAQGGGAEEPPPEPAVPGAEPVPSQGGGADPTPWIVLGIGGAVAVAGAILLGVAASEASRVTGATDGSRWEDLEGVASSAQAMWAAGWATLGVGLAAAAAGIGWGIAAGSGGERAELRIVPNGVVLAGAFQ
jgi:hypothetical protein